jgi:hypothetical protein
MIVPGVVTELGGETMNTEPTSSQQSDEGLVEDLDVDEEAGKDVAGGARRAGDPCDGGEVA